MRKQSTGFDTGCELHRGFTPAVHRAHVRGPVGLLSGQLSPYPVVATPSQLNGPLALMQRCVSFHAAIAVLIIALFASPALAQTEIVAAVKNDLIARHVNLSGPCGAFEITKRVAWTLRSQGYGLLSKPAGNNCQGYSVDYLTRMDGSGLDILGDGGGDNSPQWGESEPPGTLSGRWVAPFDPGDVVVVVPPPVVIPPPVTVPLDLSGVYAKLDALSLQLKEHDENPSWLKKALSDHYVQVALTAIGTYFTTRQVMK